MKVSRRSWHYRLHVFVFTCFNLETYGPIDYIEGLRYEHQPKSLCTYFWSTVTLLALFVAFIGPVLAGTALVLVIYYFIQGISQDSRSSATSFERQTARPGSNGFRNDMCL